jgi:hypothetical protein
MRGQQAAAAIASSVRERMLHKACAAAALFEARWTMNALLREAPDLHEAVEDQRGMFHESLVTGDDAEITKQGEAMCRGWAAAIVAMEKSHIADDAYHIGQFGKVTVAVGRQQKAPDWFREQYGDEVVWLSPREVAALYAKLEIGQALKAVWPDGEIVDVRAKDGADV